MQKIFIKILAIFLSSFCFTNITLAETNIEKIFYVDPAFSKVPSYTLEAESILIKNGLHIYIDSDYLNSKTVEEQSKIKEESIEASLRFKENQQKVTALFGRELSPGLDNDSNIVVLLYPLKDNAKGYIRVIDKYEKMIAPLSNESEMVYLDVDKIDSPFFDSFLIHEYTHLIFENQKTADEAYLESNTWLTELYSEYAATIIENEDVYGYFDQRIKDFFKNPSTSLTEWSGDVYDYATITLFSHYIADNYGEDILAISMRSNKVGIDSIDYALKTKKYNETFEDVFKNFAIALAINDCTNNEHYCFKNNKLKNFTIMPYNNFLPFSGEAVMSIGQSIYNWSSQWQKFTGGGGGLEITFDGQDDVNIQAKYIAKTKGGKYAIGDLELNEKKEGKVLIPDMNENYESVIIIPIVADRLASNKSFEKYGYEIKAKVIEKEEEQAVDQTYESVFDLNKPLAEMTKRELLILLVRILLFKQGYNF